MIDIQPPCLNNSSLHSRLDDRFLCQHNHHLLLQVLIPRFAFRASLLRSVASCTTLWQIVRTSWLRRLKQYSPNRSLLQSSFFKTETAYLEILGIIITSAITHLVYIVYLKAPMCEGFLAGPFAPHLVDCYRPPHRTGHLVGQVWMFQIVLWRHLFGVGVRRICRRGYRRLELQWHWCPNWACYQLDSLVTVEFLLQRSFLLFQQPVKKSSKPLFVRSATVPI